MNKRRHKAFNKRKISRECWSLDYAFIKWLNIHLKVYKKDASKIVNLEYHKFTYEEKELTQLEIINRLIQITDYLLISDRLELEYWHQVNQMLDLWKLVFPAMWW